VCRLGKWRSVEREGDFEVFILCKQLACLHSFSLCKFCTEFWQVMKLYLLLVVGSNPKAGHFAQAYCSAMVSRKYHKELTEDLYVRHVYACMPALFTIDKVRKYKNSFLGAFHLLCITSLLGPLPYSWIPIQCLTFLNVLNLGNHYSMIQALWASVFSPGKWKYYFMAKFK
jgi:hypothetical protein